MEQSVERFAMLNDEELIDSARNALGTFCSEHCDAMCSSKGKLSLSDAEASTIVQNRKKSLQKGLLSEEVNGTFTLTLDGGCLALKQMRCTVYAKRPLVCRDYPLFVFGSKIIVAPCPGVAAGLLDRHLAELSRRGFRQF